jgi:hypothetical protein
MRRCCVRAAIAVSLMTVVMVGTSGEGWATGLHKASRSVSPTLTSALSSPSVALGGSATDTATVTGDAKRGSPTGSVTFSECGPTTSATACTSPNGGSATVALVTGTRHRSTADVIVDPGAPGWYCVLDQYSGDTHYKPVSDNNAATECLDVTGSGTTITPALTSSLSQQTASPGSDVIDTATVTGNSADGPPTGTVTFSVCGPTTSATPCTVTNAGSATVELNAVTDDQSQAGVSFEPSSSGWFCFLDQYSGDSNYQPADDNDTGTQCLDVTGSGTGGTSTPTLSTSLSSPSVPVGSSAVDTATVTGNATGGSPPGTVTFSVCGPTTSPAACTSPTIGPAVAQLSPESGNRSFASSTIYPDSPGWYCFLAVYSGSSYYSSVSDNSTASECLDVTGTSSEARRGPRSTLVRSTAS